MRGKLGFIWCMNIFFEFGVGISLSFHPICEYLFDFTHDFFINFIFFIFLLLLPLIQGLNFFIFFYNFLRFVFRWWFFIELFRVVILGVLNFYFFFFIFFWWMSLHIYSFFLFNLLKFCLWFFKLKFGLF